MLCIGPMLADWQGTTHGRQRLHDVAISPAICDDDSQVGKHHRPSDQHPTRPSRNEDRPDDTGGPDTHRDQVAASTGLLLLTQRLARLGDREDLGFWACHTPTVGPMGPLRSSALRKE